VSICDGTTHAESARKSQTDGTRPSLELRIAIRLPLLRFLSFLDPFVQQPRLDAVVFASARRLLGTICERAVRARADDRNYRRERAQAGARVGRLVLVLRREVARM
jgi:hypothetical protein